MKVVYLNSVALLGGAERSLLDLLASIRQARPEAELSLVTDADGPLAKQARAIGVRTHTLPLPPAIAGWGDSALVGQGRLARLFSVARQGLPAGLAARRYARQLRELIAPLAPDVIHSNGIKTHLLASMMGVSTPIVWHLRDFIGRRALVRRLLAWYAKRAALAIAVSQAAAADARLALPGLRVEAVYDSIDTDHFQPGPGEGAWLDELATFPPALAGEEPIRIGIVAAYARWKGQEVFLDAAARALKTRAPGARPLRFFIVGGPIYATAGSQWTEAELKARAAALELTPYVGFIPFQNDVARIYRALDIMVHASTEPEPFGRTIVEGQACARAVIAATAGGAAELVADGRDAVGVPPRDAEALAKAMLRLADNDFLRAKLGEAGRKNAAERFSLARVGQEVLALYDELLAR